jgi:ASC-1-like (ASCH) protein
MKTHELKLSPNFWEPVISGKKCFEIRKNDRDYRQGDRVIFYQTLENDETAYLVSPEFKITYVLSGWGLQEGYVCFGIKEVKG